jgi:hypothetical protein
MSAARQFDPGSTFEDIVSEGFSRARQGAVIVVESRGLPAPRVRWLERQLMTSIPGGAVHLAGDSLFVILVRHAGPAETWLLVERLRRQLVKSGWEHTLVASATWPVQGSSPMDVVAAALASLFDERTRFEQERGQHEVWLELEGHGGFNWASAGDLLSG